MCASSEWKVCVSGSRRRALANGHFLMHVPLCNWSLDEPGSGHAVLAYLRNNVNCSYILLADTTDVVLPESLIFHLSGILDKKIIIMRNMKKTHRNRSSSFERVERHTHVQKNYNVHTYKDNHSINKYTKNYKLY